MGSTSVYTGGGVKSAQRQCFYSVTELSLAPSFQMGKLGGQQWVGRSDQGWVAQVSEWKETRSGCPGLRRGQHAGAKR